jgi:serpin B
VALRARTFPVACSWDALWPRALALCLVCAGCSTSSSGAPSGGLDEARSGLPRDTSPDPSAADQAALEAGNAAFAFDLYAALRQPGRNLFFSPHSITSALAMTYAGARGGTSDQMARTMHLSLPADRAPRAFDWLDLQLASRASIEPASGGKPFTLRTASSLWGERTESWHDAYLDTLEVDYGAGIHLADFAGDPGGAERAMDLWVDAQTDGRIAQLVPPSSIDAGTRLVIANAVLFEASWESPFRVERTAPAPFTRSDGSVEQLPTMHQSALFFYARDAEGWQVVELPYTGGKVALDIALPPAGSGATLDEEPTADRFASAVASLRVVQVDLALPRLSVPAATLAVGGALRRLGMTSVFAPGADLTGMCDDAPWLRDVFHQATLTVDENGTQAAAATAGVVATALRTPVPVTVDRPFFLAIRDRPTGTILFAGAIDAP